MSTKNTPDRNPERASAELDALLNRGIQADRRANKPVLPTPLPPPPPTIATTPATPPSTSSSTSSMSLNPLEKLTVRFTKEEAKLLERARAAARNMGFKISDTAVFRLALNAFKLEQMTPQILEAILAADGRRRHN